MDLGQRQAQCLWGASSRSSALPKCNIAEEASLADPCRSEWSKQAKLQLKNGRRGLTLPRLVKPRYLPEVQP